MYTELGQRSSHEILTFYDKNVFSKVMGFALAMRGIDGICGSKNPGTPFFRIWFSSHWVRGNIGFVGTMHYTEFTRMP